MVTSGLIFGAGFFVESFGAFWPLISNTICINIAGIGTFLVQGIQPSHWWETKKAKSMTRKVMLLWISLLLVLLVIMRLQVTVVAPVR